VKSFTTWTTCVSYYGHLNISNLDRALEIVGLFFDEDQVPQVAKADGHFLVSRARLVAVDGEHDRGAAGALRPRHGRSYRAWSPRGRGTPPPRELNMGPPLLPELIAAFI